MTTPAEASLPVDVLRTLTRCAALTCVRVLADMRDACPEQLPYPDWCASCQSRLLVEKYSARHLPEDKTLSDEEKNLAVPSGQTSKDNSLEAAHPHVSRNPGIYGGAPIVSGVRFTVSNVLGYLATHHDIKSICETWQLTEEAVRDAIGYAQDVYLAALYPATQAESGPQLNNAPDQGSLQHLPNIPDDIDVCPNCGNVRYFSDPSGTYTLRELIERLVEGGRQPGEVERQRIMDRLIELGYGQAVIALQAEQEKE